ncbi:Hypothetical predicted protein [Mytilus galloprovincialis]|uniref:Uncharacterized protein n=1 Tax=Mytilus galloprovincialis TaxID=29158 RepID=A0A8B6DPI7_MYTGA|nr:Hypothetical predicted protein [Mytilus galloprovincialis]
MYQSFLPDKISKTYCNSSKLKAKLEKHYKDAIVFFAQQGQGKSSIVFASDISIGDAVKAANSIKAELELLEIKADLSTCSSTKTNEQTDMHVLYAAASILRQKMENVYISGDYYPANDEASLEMSEAMLPTSLISFITWLLDKKSFETFSSVSMDISHDIRRKCAALAECLVSNCILHGTFGFNTRQRFERKQDKALVYDEKVSSLMQCLPFTKPKMRGEPLRRQNALELLNSCTDPIGQTPDLLWVIRRMICREGSVLPHELSSNCTEQFVPFWSGFFSTLADFKPDRTIVAYGPIIDNKPSDMATVFTAMHNCQNLAQISGMQLHIN